MLTHDSNGYLFACKKLFFFSLILIPIAILFFVIPSIYPANALFYLPGRIRLKTSLLRHYNIGYLVFIPRLRILIPLCDNQVFCNMSLHHS